MTQFSSLASLNSFSVQEAGGLSLISIGLRGDRTHRST